MAGGVLLLTVVSFNLVLNLAALAPAPPTRARYPPPSPLSTPPSSPPHSPLPPNVREWASGRNLRGGADAPLPDSETPAPRRRVLVLHVVAGDPSEADVENINYFVRHGMRQPAAAEADFVIATFGTRTARWGTALEAYSNSSVASGRLLHLDTGSSTRSADQLLALALETLRSHGVELPSYRGLVVLSARVRGPLLPKYAVMLESWPALLLSALSHGAQIAAGSVDCVSSAVRFDGGGPVAFNMRFLLRAERLGLIGGSRGVEELSLYARLAADASVRYLT